MPGVPMWVNIASAGKNKCEDFPVQIPHFMMTYIPWSSIEDSETETSLENVAAHCLSHYSCSYPSSTASSFLQCNYYILLLHFKHVKYITQDQRYLSIPFLRGICISFFALSRFDCEWNQCKMYGLFSCVKFTSETATILFCKTWLWLATTTKEIQGKGSVTGTSENARNVQKQGDVDRNTWKNRAELRSFWTFWIRKRTT